jgi:hypothetical protein
MESGLLTIIATKCSHILVWVHMLQMPPCIQGASIGAARVFGDNASIFPRALHPACGNEEEAT